MNVVFDERSGRSGRSDGHDKPLNNMNQDESIDPNCSKKLWAKVRLILDVVVKAVITMADLKTLNIDAKGHLFAL